MRQSYLDALNGEGNANHARSAFSAAAKEVEIYVEMRTPSDTYPGTDPAE